MDSLIVALAQGGLVIVALGAVAVWWREPPAERLVLAVQAVLALVVALVLIKVAAGVHSDPRPFVGHPGVHPLFAHPADNGFPSDHTAVGVTTAAVVLARRRLAGALLLLVAVAVGLARVAAHVHHLQDIAAGTVIGLLAGAAGVVAGARLVSGWRASRATAAPSRRTARSGR